NLNGLHVRNTGSGIIIIGESTNLGIYNYYGYLFSDQGEYLWGNEGRHILEIDAYPSICLYDDCFYLERSGDWSYQRLLERYDYEGEMLWNDSVMWLENGDALGTKMLMRDDKIIIYSSLSFDWTSGKKVFLKGYYPDSSPIEGIPAEGLLICDEYAGQGLLDVNTSEPGKNIVLWEDSRNVGFSSSHKSIYAQKIDLTVLGEDDNEVISPVIINNYPNPFKEGTWFKVQEPGFRETGTIEIFNIKGQKLRTLDLEREISFWDGTNEKQKHVGSGIYLYRLIQDENEKSSGKMTLIK
ncbi:MAG: T9SS type A sorting domain-containing protein, partial [Candidatus Stygibacter frigidus]|nr:T9SS type A sorting domain-containing protein [Candidatus Stygibacter frigidus]